MIEKIKRVLKCLLSILEKSSDAGFDKNYEIYDRMLKNKREELKRINRIIGEDPMEQIDWIIENGLEKLSDLQLSKNEKISENRRLTSPHCKKKESVFNRGVMRREWTPIGVLEYFNKNKEYNEVTVIEIPTRTSLRFDEESGRLYEYHRKSVSIAYSALLEYEKEQALRELRKKFKMEDFEEFKIKKYRTYGMHSVTR